jgi:hypothetical protein
MEEEEEGGNSISMLTIPSSPLNLFFFSGLWLRCYPCCNYVKRKVNETMFQE